ncbi:hypothetical protein ACFY2R_27670 [Micromonospora olivasterospora]|uniref:Uncharacterized protein n=1 Tax=Micromonospora olivasterospora TaxID=1880 RepID=A0A562IFI9_MICOL|nr:hypothetical protein [Micromonospora olivasterospora]TWH69503.1 hypothetical protein JD77_04513 [Micromonospora olivasterospora]
MSAPPGPHARLAGGLLLWYGVLGGAVAWSVHALAAWSLSELACASGSERVAAVPLWEAVGLAVVIPGLAAVGSLLVAVLAWRRTTRARPAGGDSALGRSRMLAAVGIWSNLLFLTIIALGGVAVLVLPPCQR